MHKLNFWRFYNDFLISLHDNLIVLNNTIDIILYSNTYIIKALINIH